MQFYYSRIYYAFLCIFFVYLCLHLVVAEWDQNSHVTGRTTSAGRSSNLTDRTATFPADLSKNETESQTPNHDELDKNRKRITPFFPRYKRNFTSGNYLRRNEVINRNSLEPTLSEDHTYRQRWTRGSNTPTDICAENICLNGADCVNNTCKCLDHFTGIYCADRTDYCSDACPDDVPCFPRLGGFWCSCPPTHIGERCEEEKRHAQEAMVEPDILYHPFQYHGISYQYAFFARSIGSLPKVTIDFGDGTVKTLLKVNFTSSVDGRLTLIKYFNPPLFLPFHTLDVAIVKHQFAQNGVHNITVTASSGVIRMFRTKFQLRVKTATGCTMIAILRNCAISPEDAVSYHRRLKIVIYSAVQVNCMKTVLEHRWKLYKVKSFDNVPGLQDEFDVSDRMVMNHSNLVIPAFFMPYGKYVVRLTVSMLAPMTDINDSAVTWFIINPMPLVADINGGTVTNARWSDSFMLDARASHDPNLPKNRQTPLNYTWYCKREDIAVSAREMESLVVESDYCKGMETPLRQREVILVIPPRVLAPKTIYTFKLKVSKGKDFSERFQKIMIVQDDTPIIRITCYRNCDEIRSNPRDVTSLEAVCVSCGDTTELKDFTWNIYTDNQHMNVNVSATEFGLGSPRLIIYENAFKEAGTYSIMFKGKGDDPDDVKDLTGKAEYVLVMNEPPKPGYCIVDPTSGYAMVNTFVVTCREFTDETLPYVYEVVQYTNLSNLVTDGVMVGYDESRILTEISLGPGLVEHSYVTTLRVTVTDELAQFSYVEYNVTVWPTLLYVKDAAETVRRFQHMSIGDTSPMAMMQAVGNIPGLLQTVMSTCMAMEGFTESTEAKNLNQTELITEMEEIREIMVAYVSNQPILSMTGLRHSCATLDVLLRVPLTHFNSTTINVAAQLFKYFQKTLTLEIATCLVTRVEVQDYGVCAVSVASKLLAKPVDVHGTDARIMEPIVMYDEDEVRKHVLENLNIDEAELETRYLAFTNQVFQEVFKFGYQFIPFKVLYERVSEFTGLRLTLLVKATMPTNKLAESLSVKGVGSIVPSFPEHWYDEHQIVNMQAIFMTGNPYWWHPAAREINFPVLHVEFEKHGGTKVFLPSTVELYATNRVKPMRVRGELKIYPYWTLNDYDIEVTRARLPKGGKLLVHFMPSMATHKLQVVVKKGVRPELSDFWTSAITIPQESPDIAGQYSYSIYIDDAAEHDDSFYYVGIMPHLETLHALLEEDETERDFPGMHDPLKGGPTTRRVVELSNVTQPYEMALYSVRCLSWSDATMDWTSGCEAAPATTYMMVQCRCEQSRTISASYTSVPNDLSMFRGVHFFITFTDNPLVVLLVLLLMLLFLALLLWAFFADLAAKRRQCVIFLADNDPRHTHCYLIMVETGRQTRAGTSSRVTVQLEGCACSSEAHVLDGGPLRLMQRCSQDWFILCTACDLGDLHWLHMWIEHRGASPTWFCERVVVHDIHSNQVWVFLVDQWLHPLFGDGSMACSIYRVVDWDEYAHYNRFSDAVTYQLDTGTHGWMGVCYRHPESSFTRFERVGVLLAHVALLMLVVVILYEIPIPYQPTLQMESYDFYWHWMDFARGAIAALICFPIHLLVALMFRCAEPMSRGGTHGLCGQYMVLDYRHVVIEKKVSESNVLPVRSSAALIDRTASRQSVTTVDTITTGTRVTRTSSGDLERRRSSKMVVEHRRSTLMVERKKRTVMVHQKRSILLSEPKTKNMQQEEFQPTGAEGEQNVMLRARKTVTFRRSLMNPSKDKQSILQSSRKYTFYPPMIAKKGWQSHYCLPFWFVIIGWILVIIITLFSVFFVILIGVSYGWVMSMRFLVALVTAMIISALILETAKLLIAAACTMLNRGRRVVLEDRSEIAYYVFRANRLNVLLIPHKLDELEILREDEVYRPVPEARARLLRGNALVGVTMRGVLSLICILLMFIAILACIIGGIGDRMGWYTTSHLQQLVAGRHGFGRTVLMDVNSPAGLMHYIDSALLAVIHERLKVDRGNVLLGVPRLRQLRWKPEDCQWNDTWLGVACPVPFSGDTTDYGPHWSPFNKSAVVGRWRHLAQSWQYQYSWLPNGGGYVALLRRSETSSRIHLRLLQRQGWLDYYSRHVFVEFPLYNPNRDVLSLVSVEMERHPSGWLRRPCNVELLRARATITLYEVIVMALFVLLVVAMALYVRREDAHLHRARTASYLGGFWYILIALLAIVVIVVAATYSQRTVTVYATLAAMGSASTNKYVDLSHAIFWDHVFLYVAITIMFITLIYLWIMLLVKSRFLILSATLTRLWRPIGWVVFTFSCLLLGFMFLGYLLFVFSSYTFHSLMLSLLSVVGFSHRNFEYRSLVNTPQDSTVEKEHWGRTYYLFAVFNIFFIFRWLFAIIIIYKLLRQRYKDRQTPDKLTRKPEEEDQTSKTVKKIVSSYGNRHSPMSDARMQAMRNIIRSYLSWRRDPDFAESRKQREFYRQARIATMSSLVVDLAAAHMRTRALQTRPTVFTQPADLPPGGGRGSLAETCLLVDKCDKKLDHLTDAISDFLCEQEESYLESLTHWTRNRR